MENLLNILNLFNTSQKSEPNYDKTQIPKEILDQYPYGEFPIRYTRPGQESIRKNSENRFSYTSDNQDHQQEHKTNKHNDLDLSNLLPLIQAFSSKEHKTNDIMKILSKLLFKDNPELAKLFDLFPKSNSKIKGQEIDNSHEFPETNKVSISSLKRVD